MNEGVLTTPVGWRETLRDYPSLERNVCSHRRLSSCLVLAKRYGRSAVGADNSEKQELEPGLLSQSKIVVDVLEQCAAIGELHHAIGAGLASREEVYAELGEVIAGVRPGRTSSDEIIVFDSTGMALQDVVTAAAVYEKAISQAAGSLIKFAA